MTITILDTIVLPAMAGIRVEILEETQAGVMEAVEVGANKKRDNIINKLM